MGIIRFQSKFMVLKPIKREGGCGKWEKIAMNAACCMPHVNSDRARARNLRTGVSTATHDARHRPAPPSSSTHGRSGGLNRELQPQAARQKFKSIPKENHI